MATDVLDRLPFTDNLQMADIVSKGVSIVTFQTLARLFGLSSGKLAIMVGIAPRTLARRKGDRLNAAESERVLRAGRLFKLAADVFEDDVAAKNWFMRPLRALGGKTPLELCSTEFGAREVEQTLGRIEHGVFA